MTRLLGLVLIAAAPALPAAEAIYNGCNGAWSTAACWTNTISLPPSQTPPVAGEDVTINFLSAATLDVDAPALKSLTLFGTLNQSAQSMTSKSLVLGASPNGFGVYNLSGGSLTLGAIGGSVLDFEVGGTVNQGGGTVTAALGLSLNSIPLSGHTAAYNLSDGTLSAQGLLVGTGVSPLGPLGTFVNDGVFSQSGGAATFSGPVIFGGPANPAVTGGGSGKATISGGTFDVADTSAHMGMIVAGTGTATVTQTDGTVTVKSGPDAGGMEIGRSVGSSGSYTLEDGALNVQRESVAGANAYLVVGNAGSGSFTQSGGEVSVEGTVTLGFAPGGSGDYSLSGKGSLDTEHLVIRTGTFSQSGGDVSIDTNTPGPAGGSLSIFSGGAYVLSAGITNDSKLEVDFTEIIQGGTFNQSGGSNSVDGPLTLTSGGQYLLSGTGSQLTVGDDVTVTNSSITQTGGHAQVNGALSIDGAGAAAVGSYSLGGIASNLAVAGEEVIGDGGHGTFTQTAGTNSLSGGTLTLGRAATGAGEYHLSGSALLSAGGDVIVGDAGTGLFEQTGGVAQIAGTLTVGGSAGGEGTYTFSNGALHVAGDVVIGGGGNGTFTQSGGLHTVGGNLVVASAAGSSGLYRLTDGTLQVSGDELIGRVQGDAPSSANSLVQSAGANQVGGTLVVGAGGGGIYRLDGGSLQATREVIGQGSGSAGVFDQSNGTNQVAVTLTIGGTAGASGTYNLAGGIVAAGTPKTDGLINNDALNVTGPARIDANVLNNASGTIQVTGAVLNVNGNITNFGVIALDPSRLTAQTLTVGASGYLSAGVGDVLALTGNLINQSTQSVLWNTSAAELDFTGGGVHTLTLAGHDSLSFSNNFAWGTLALGASDTLDLARGAGDALYVGALSGLDISGKLITNIDGASGLFVYYNPAANPALSGNYFLEGGGELLAFAGGGGGGGGGGGTGVPEPGMLPLLLAALGALALRLRGIVREPVRRRGPGT